MMAREVFERDPADFAALPRRDRVNRFPEVPPFPRLDLDEHRRLPVAGDDVDLPCGPPVAPRKDFVAARFELAAGQVFTVVAKGDACVGHIARGQQTSSLPYLPTSVSDSSRIRIATSACARVSTSGGEKRIEFFPAPRISRPRLKAALTTASRSSPALSLVCRS